MYDLGWPQDDWFSVRPSVGDVADSIFFTSYAYITTYWFLPESLSVGRYSIVVDYSSSPCRDMSDTTWVTIIP